MANVLVERQSLQNIADAIRDKNGSSDTYTPSEMSQAILDIPTGGGGEFATPVKVDEVLIIPTSIISARIIYEKTLSRHKTLDVL